MNKIRRSIPGLVLLQGTLSTLYINHYYNRDTVAVFSIFLVVINTGIFLVLTFSKEKNL